jgi:hypothetical protein
MQSSRIATTSLPYNQALNRTWNSAVQMAAVPFWRQPFEARRPRRRHSTPVNADPLGGTRVQASGTLELFAELFVAFAGFTGLAGVLTRSQADAPGFSQDLRILVEYSLIYLVLAVVPLVLWHSGFSEHAAWRIACVVSAIESIAYYAIRFASLRAWSSAADNKDLLWTTAIVEWSMTIALLLAALQLVPIPPSNLYIFHLLLGLVGTALSFGRLAKPIWEETRGE